MESCLYQGWVHHRRAAPVRHDFRVPLFMLYLDLEELPRVFRGRWLWSTRRPALARFRREDHLGDPAQPLDGAVRDLVEARCGRRLGGPIRLLTHPRYFGFVFNPVSLFYCFGSSGGLEAVVAEVTNTPWNERHCYVLAPEPGGTRGGFRLRTDKEFHVSPFMGMDDRYHWTIREPGRRLGLAIANHGRDGSRHFEAALALRRVEIDAVSLARVLVRHPWMTLEVVAGIYWQAYRLRRKGAPYHPHPREGGAPLEVVS